jgi:hypothetical protein
MPPGNRPAAFFFKNRKLSRDNPAAMPVSQSPG